MEILSEYLVADFCYRRGFISRSSRDNRVSIVSLINVSARGIVLRADRTRKMQRVFGEINAAYILAQWVLWT